jgi:hypothetical protein
MEREPLTWNLLAWIVCIGMKRTDFFEIVLHIFDTDAEWNTL